MFPSGGSCRRYWEPICCGFCRGNWPPTGRMRFYVCPRCGNILTSTGKASISCCGRALAPLEAARETGGHRLAAEEMDGEWYVTIQHPMTKGHYIAFAACVSDD